MSAFQLAKPARQAALSRNVRHDLPLVCSGLGFQILVFNQKWFGELLKNIVIKRTRKKLLFFRKDTKKKSDWGKCSFEQYYPT